MAVQILSHWTARSPPKDNFWLASLFQSVARVSNCSLVPGVVLIIAWAIHFSSPGPRILGARSAVTQHLHSQPPPGHNRFRVCSFMAAPLHKQSSFSCSHTSSEAWVPFLRCKNSVPLSGNSAVRRSKNVPERHKKAFVDEGKWAELWRMDAIWTRGARHILCLCGLKVCWDRAEGVCCGLFTQKEVQTTRAPLGFEATLCSCRRRKEIYFYLIK